MKLSLSYEPSSKQTGIKNNSGKCCCKGSVHSGEKEKKESFYRAL